MMTIDDLKKMMPTQQNELKDLSDEILIRIAQSSCENSVTQKDRFISFWNLPKDTNLYYQVITNELEKRGYVKDWHRPETKVSDDQPETIQITMTSDKPKRRVSMTVSEELAIEFENIIKSYQFPKPTLSIINDYIINTFVEKIKNDQIEFVTKYERK